MRPFLDSGFLLTLLLKTNGSEMAWEIAQKLDGPFLLTSLQILSAENRFLRELEGEDSTPATRAQSANALQNFRWYLEQHVFQSVAVDYSIAIDLAYQWQRRSKPTLPTMLLLWPALAITIGASHFLSFDPRTRQLAESGGLTVLPERL